LLIYYYILYHATNYLKTDTTYRITTDPSYNNESTGLPRMFNALFNISLKN